MVHSLPKVPMQSHQYNLFHTLYINYNQKYILYSVYKMHYSYFFISDHMHSFWTFHAKFFHTSTGLNLDHFYPKLGTILFYLLSCCSTFHKTRHIKATISCTTQICLLHFLLRRAILYQKYTYFTHLKYVKYKKAHCCDFFIFFLRKVWSYL